MIIAVDFDKTLHLGEWPQIGVPAPYAIEVMQRLCMDGHFIILWTCREGKELLDAINWMLLRSIPFNLVNENHPDIVSKHGWNSKKVYADKYIDDKGIGGLPSWKKIYEIISETANNE